MKNILLFLFISLAVKSVAQNKDCLISTHGIGAIKIDMKLEELEKLLLKKIPLTNPSDTISGSWEDSAQISYKNMQLKIQFQRSYTGENNFFMRIIGMQTSSPQCKTIEGIGIGSGKEDIIAAYENNIVVITPDFEEDALTKSQKGNYIITVRDIYDSTMLVFHLINKKVISMEAAIHFTDCE